MRYARLALIGCFLSFTTACAGDTTQAAVQPGVIDQSALLQNGVLVTLNSGIGTLTVPFETDNPVPDVDDSDFQDSMVGAVSVVVTSVLSGSSASLAAGMPLDVGATGGGMPSAPGEFTWTLNGARDEATMTFYNESPSGLTLKAGNPYNASFAISNNDYVETLPAIMLSVSVTGS